MIYLKINSHLHHHLSLYVHVWAVDIEGLGHRFHVSSVCIDNTTHQNTFATELKLNLVAVITILPLDLKMI